MKQNYQLQQMEHAKNLALLEVCKKLIFQPKMTKKRKAHLKSFYAVNL